MKPYCPYCKKEITVGEIQCPSCGTTYSLDTLLLVRSLVKEAVTESPDEPRKYDRVPKEYKVTYTTPQTLIKHYLSNISQGGIFIQTKEPLKRREKLNLKIFLPNEEKGLEVFCEVAWSRKEERVTPKGRYPQGMGLKFLNLSPEDKERISRILTSST